MKTSLILGFFDGVHAGHKAVINSALNYGEETILITFQDSPAVYFKKDTKYILSREDSVNKIKSLGVNKVIELDFAKIAHMSAKEYLEFLITTYSPISISTGFNHTFGFKKSGNSDFLTNNQKKYGYKYFCIPPVKDSEEVISSTRIKKLFEKGNIKEGNRLLESHFSITGKVIHGEQIGQKIGFPTANINYPEQIVKLPYGVYCSEVNINDCRYKGFTNWGMKPTLNNTAEPTFETHILNYNGNLYGKTLRIEIIDYIRKEQKFSSLEELKNQIKKDVELCSK